MDTRNSASSSSTANITQHRRRTQSRVGRIAAGAWGSSERNRDLSGPTARGRFPATTTAERLDRLDGKRKPAVERTDPDVDAVGHHPCDHYIRCQSQSTTTTEICRFWCDSRSPTWRDPEAPLPWQRSGMHHREERCNRGRILEQWLDSDKR